MKQRIRYVPCGPHHIVVINMIGETDENTFLTGGHEDALFRCGEANVLDIVDYYGNSTNLQAIGTVIRYEKYMNIKLLHFNIRKASSGSINYCKTLKGAQHWLEKPQEIFDAQPVNGIQCDV